MTLHIYTVIKRKCDVCDVWLSDYSKLVKHRETNLHMRRAASVSNARTTDVGSEGDGECGESPCKSTDWMPFGGSIFHLLYCISFI